jgi:hypothetical protein
MASFIGEVDIKLSKYIEDNKKSFNFPGAY